MTQVEVEFSITIRCAGEESFKSLHGFIRSLGFPVSRRKERIGIPPVEILHSQAFGSSDSSFPESSIDLCFQQSYPRIRVGRIHTHLVFECFYRIPVILPYIPVDLTLQVVGIGMGWIEGEDYFDLSQSLTAVISTEKSGSGQMCMRTGLVVMRFKVVRCLKYCPPQVIKGAPCSTGQFQHRPSHPQ